MTQHSYEYLRGIKEEFSKKYLSSKELPFITSVGMSTKYPGCLKVGLKKCKSVYVPLTFRGVYIRYEITGEVYFL